MTERLFFIKRERRCEIRRVRDRKTKVQPHPPDSRESAHNPSITHSSDVVQVLHREVPPALEPTAQGMEAEVVDGAESVEVGEAEGE